MAGEAGQEWYTPPDRHQTAGGEGGTGPISKLCNNKQQRLGPEWSMSEVITSPPHSFYKSHGLVASNTHTHTHVGNYSIICGIYKHLYLYNMGYIIKMFYSLFSG